MVVVLVRKELAYFKLWCKTNLYNFTPNTGFVIDTLFVNGLKVDSITSYTFDSVKSNQTISVKFKVQTFTITSTAGNGGSITPQGINTLNYGTKPIYTILRQILDM